jgi:hypothetical protein
MALIDTFNGSVAVACFGGFLIFVGKSAIRNGVEFYREFFNKDPIRTTSFDLLLAFLQHPRANPVVFGIMIWLGGWFFAFLGFICAIARLGSS